MTKKVQAYASGREVVLWCATCHGVIARLGGMHTVDYIITLNDDHVCKDNDGKTQSGS